MKQQYAVFCGTKWGRFTSKRVAMASAKSASVRYSEKADVRAMPYEPGAWDAPTFRSSSERIATFYLGGKIR